MNLPACTRSLTAVWLLLSATTTRRKAELAPGEDEGIGVYRAETGHLPARGQEGMGVRGAPAGHVPGTPPRSRRSRPLRCTSSSIPPGTTSTRASPARPSVGNHDIYHAPPEFFALYLDCRANKGDWWWGSEKYKGPEVGPTEKRVIDTVKWVIKEYGIDENRVYLCGNSMGGSGALGIGMRHGDVFAAIKANVPAGVEHVSSRMYFAPRTVPADVTLPDPPIVVDYSAPNDGWSKGHDTFAKAMNERKYALFLYWGPFGHANNHEQILKVNDLINSFDWLSVKKNEPYPVFTNASTNDPLPWPDHLADKKPGQVNAFFRWKNVSDTADAVETQLFLVKAADLKTSFTDPDRSDRGRQLAPAAEAAGRPRGDRALDVRLGQRRGQGRRDGVRHHPRVEDHGGTDQRSASGRRSSHLSAQGEARILSGPARHPRAIRTKRVQERAAFKFPEPVRRLLPGVDGRPAGVRLPRHKYATVRPGRSPGNAALRPGRA